MNAPASAKCRFFSAAPLQHPQPRGNLRHAEEIPGLEGAAVPGEPPAQRAVHVDDVVGLIVGEDLTDVILVLLIIVMLFATKKIDEADAVKW